MSNDSALLELIINERHYRIGADTSVALLQVYGKVTPLFPVCNIVSMVKKRGL